VPAESSVIKDEVPTAEVIAALCLATDIAMGLPFEHGLQSTVFAIRLADRLGVDAEAESQVYYGCLLFYAGCTADAEISAELFSDGALLTHFSPVMFGTAAQTMGGVVRALASSARTPPGKAFRVATTLPSAVRGHQQHVTAMCEVAAMLSNRLGVPPAVRDLFDHFTERWDGKGQPGVLSGPEIPFPLRVIHVARDAALQSMIGGVDYAASVVRERAGGAFDPEIAGRLSQDADDILAFDDGRSAWDEVLAGEPVPRLMLQGDAIDQALAAMGDFADLVSTYLVGHSAGVAQLASAAALRCGFPTADVLAMRRAALVHDVGRVGISARVWQKSAPLTPDEWEHVRLHAYHTERILSRSPFLAALGSIATFHHERLDGSGYHRGVPAAALSPAARLLAAADEYHTKTEVRPHRSAMPPSEVADLLGQEVRSGRLDRDSVAAVLEAEGQRTQRLTRPAGLTEREAQVIGLIARGLQTKQVGRALGISTKTADRHVQNAYAKIGVSTRAAATVFAMQYGLAAWGELPIAGAVVRS
jgi:HD-GYP domain-containing protein (c-di-GMP phosphodiesterase class II)